MLKEREGGEAGILRMREKRKEEKEGGWEEGEEGNRK